MGAPSRGLGEGRLEALSGGLTRKQVLRRGSALGMGVSAAGLLASCGGGDASSPSSGSGAKGPEGNPQRGGQLTVAVESAGPAESFNPAQATSPAVALRQQQIYDGLGRPGTLEDPLEPGLVLEWLPNKDGSVWDLKLRPDVTWHNGKDFTADDIIFMVRKLWNRPTHPAYKTAQLMKLDQVKKLDPLTLRIPLKAPNAQLYHRIGATSFVTQEGQTDFTKPIGTGPFVFESFQPGQQSIVKRNPNYWDEGKPYLDSLKMISIADPAARLNALLSGAIDVNDSLPYTQGKRFEKNDSFVLLKALSQYPNFYMRVDQAPFKDVRVRQAMKLIADRQALINGALGGFGEVRNDLTGKGLQFYASDLPQREQDIEQAKSLLKQAGAQSVSVTLRTSAALPGLIEASQLYAQQAKAAGVTITLKQVDPAAQFNPSLGYLTWPFGAGIWPPDATIGGFYDGGVRSDGAYNETHWSNPQTDKWIEEANRTLDDELAKEIWHNVQEQQYNEGGNVFWGQTINLGASSNKVGGIKPNGWQSIGDNRVWDWWKQA